MKLFISLLIMLAGYSSLKAQQKAGNDPWIDSLDAVLVSFNKWEQKRSEIPNQMVKIGRKRILNQPPQTSADLLANTGTVFVQKSQMGGGSPMIRGFATNRVLLVVDGVRMNNAIYRSGNLQNIISIDALSLSSAEVVFGPGSLIYGSDAIGGVMDFHTLEPAWSADISLLLKGMAMMRYASANHENTWHADLLLGRNRWAWTGFLTHSRFADLKMGKYGGEETYLRPEYVQRIVDKDSIITNTDPRRQRFNGYEQLNILQKLAYKISRYSNLQYSFTYAGTSTAPRYDRLIQYRNGKLRFAEWNYGPMLWRMHQLRLNLLKPNALFTEGRFIAAYQVYEESRMDRLRDNPLRNRQIEKVKAFSLNADALLKTAHGTWYYGFELVHNRVRSAGEISNILTGATEEGVSRYPDPSRWMTTGLYASYKTELNAFSTLNAGLRYSYNLLRATFNNRFVPFPYQQANLQNGAFTGSAGIVYRPDAAWQLSGHASTGFRMPNVDDIGKLFESAPGNVVVPNPELKSEYAVNAEIGVTRRQAGRFRVSAHLFYTWLYNALARRPFAFNGQDSMIFNGILSQVEALQNIARATVYGVQARIDLNLTPRIGLYSTANWIQGKETDDVENKQVPLRHAPPFYGQTVLQVRPGTGMLELLWIYNSQITANELAPSEQAKPYLYAPDSQGRPYSPGWMIFSIRASYPVSKRILATLSWENLGNRQYRPYSSGLVAPGSSLAASFQWRLGTYEQEKG